MKKWIAFLALIVVSHVIYGQILKPVKWSYAAESLNQKEANLIITATIDEGWHVYSQFIEEGGPIPTTFNFIKSKDYGLVGKTSESPKATAAYDNNFAMQIAWHEKKVVFNQRVKLNTDKTIVKGTLEFMVCNDKQCLPPEEVEFSIPVSASSVISETVLLSKPTADSIADSIDTSLNKVEVKPILKTKQIGAVKNIKNSSQSLWAIFIAGFIGGLFALLMPCIYPMIPLTIGFFTKKSSTKGKAVLQAVFYGLSIIIIYVILGIMITVAFGSDALNELSSNGIFNFIFFLLLIVFAISFFGAFELTLPASWVNKIDEKSDKGGLIGLFFMAFALALVSFSCTGPIIGTLLVQAATMGELLGPALGMLGFSLALAIPFTLFALFPQLLKSLPKSGGWLNSVKVVFGFLELALALKFLSNVDLAYHWEIFDREVFLVLWIIIFGMLGIYLLGKLRFSHDVEVPYITVPRLFIAIIILSFTLYMIPGLWGAPLKAISAWLPPQTTQDFDLYTNTLSSPTVSKSKEGKKYSTLFKAPHNLDAFFDYEEGLQYAKQQNKPVLIDFTGHSCVNCRKMEAAVWSDKTVLDILKNDYVLISLYVDDKTELPEKEQYISKTSGKKIKTLGNKWSDFQASTFKTNSQPYYVIVDLDGNILVPPQAFNLDINNYVNFLNSGLTAFKNN